MSRFCRYVSSPTIIGLTKKIDDLMKYDFNIIYISNIILGKDGYYTLLVLLEEKYNPCDD